MNGSSEVQVPPRHIGFWLGLGILFMPYLFVWALLRAGHSTLSRVIGFAWTLVVIVGYVASNQPSGQSGSTSTGVTPSNSQQVADESARVWEYSSNRDEMRGTTSKLAELESENSLDFDFPYNGGARGHLMLRKEPENGLNVILRMDKGQFMSNHEYVSVKFDDDPIVRFSTSEASDNRIGVVFLSPERRFLALLRKSRKLIIEAEFYQEGRRQMTFNVAGLDPAW